MKLAIDSYQYKNVTALWIFNDSKKRKTAAYYNLYKMRFLVYLSVTKIWTTNMALSQDNNPDSGLMDDIPLRSHSLALEDKALAAYS
ncbi:hypothetical protein SHVI106290_02890 [Shewanella violacea]